MVCAISIFFDKFFGCGYFEAATFEAINKVLEKGGDVHGIFFDVAPKISTMAQKLGCDIANLIDLLIILLRKVKSMPF